MCRGPQVSLFSEERETTTYLKQAQVQNRLYNREPVQLLCDNRFQTQRSPSLTTAANGKKRRRAKPPDSAVVTWSGPLRSRRWIKQCGGARNRKMQGARENSNMPLKSGRYPRAPERLRKTVCAEQTDPVSFQSLQNFSSWCRAKSFSRINIIPRWIQIINSRSVWSLPLAMLCHTAYHRRIIDIDKYRWVNVQNVLM